MGPFVCLWSNPGSSCFDLEVPKTVGGLLGKGSCVFYSLGHPLCNFLASPRLLSGELLPWTMNHSKCLSPQGHDVYVPMISPPRGHICVDTVSGSWQECMWATV